jgi:hypothetical protein
MLFNYVLGIYCFYCKKYYDPYTEVWLNLLYEGSISCEKEHLVGNESDFEWQEHFYNYECSYFYLYHNKPNCRCVQDVCNCFGLEDECENKLGRKSYEEDKKNRKE